jgi:hypothetical protein
MLYLFAAIGVVTIAVLLWRMLGDNKVASTTPRTHSVAPDDDPEFLRKLGEENRRQDGDSGPHRE